MAPSDDDEFPVGEYPDVECLRGVVPLSWPQLTVLT